MIPRLFDALDMLLGPQHFGVVHVAAVLRVDPAVLYAALRPLEDARLLEVTKRGTPREAIYSNVGDGGPAALVAKLGELGTDGLLEQRLE